MGRTWLVFRNEVRLHFRSPATWFVYAAWQGALGYHLGSATTSANGLPWTFTRGTWARLQQPAGGTLRGRRRARQVGAEPGADRCSTSPHAPPGGGDVAGGLGCLRPTRAGDPARAGYPPGAGGPGNLVVPRRSLPGRGVPPVAAVRQAAPRLLGWIPDTLDWLSGPLTVARPVFSVSDLWGAAPEGTLVLLHHLAFAALGVALAVGAVLLR